ncbi:TniB family NTP-binding protein [Rhizobium sp.]|uniref:TniB family NTP-binding protein n=1 Tax=Rhizobium sp. TaxID=391 RepID=UPI0034C66C77
MTSMTLINMLQRLHLRLVEGTLSERGRLRTLYVESARNPTFDEHLDYLKKNDEESREGYGSRVRAVFVLGESGAGKTNMVVHHLMRRPEFQPYRDKDDRLVRPLLAIEAPASHCSTKSLAMALLEQLGIPTRQRLSEYKLYNVLYRQLKAQGVRYILIDEMHHVGHGAKSATIAKVQDVLKSLLQIDDHPIHMILVGTPPLATFLEGDQQLANRSRVMRLPNLNPKKDRPFVDRVIAEFVNTAGCTIGWKEADNVELRLVHAAKHCLGTLTEILTEACLFAKDNGRAEVTAGDLARVYLMRSGCLKRDNIFTAQNWKLIDPSSAVSDLRK